MGTMTMANSAAAALLSLQMTMSPTKGLKRRVMLENLTQKLEKQASEAATEDPLLLLDVVEKECNSSSVVSSSNVDVLPEDVIMHCFLHLDSFQDMASASRVSRRWREGMRQALACRTKLSFAGWRPDDAAVTRLVNGASSLKELNISNGRWGCRITDAGLLQISLANSCPNLTSISLWGVTAITDDGVVQLVSRAKSLEHFNVGGTFITDVSMLAISEHCPLLKCINLWCCRHVTETGLLTVAEGCPKLNSINVWGMSISRSLDRRLQQLNPALHLKPLAHPAD